MFSAEMRLPKTIPSAEKLRYCESVAYALDHFDEKMNEPVYELTLDQKKYLSVGVELVANPSILFLDEPTTGLDGLRALSMMQAVQKLSRDLQISVVCTIHQPSKPLFELFDHLVLLCKGGFLAYIGPTGKMSQDLIRWPLLRVPRVHAPPPPHRALPTVRRRRGRLTTWAAVV